VRLRNTLLDLLTDTDRNKEREPRVHQPYEDHQRNISGGRHVCFSIIDLFLLLHISCLDSYFPYKVIAKADEKKKRKNSLWKKEV